MPVVSSGASLLCGEPVPCVAESVDPQVASLAGGDDVFGGHARWVAVAEVGDGEPDSACGVPRLFAVAFGAAAQDWVPLVDAALPGTFAAALGSAESDLGGERLPTFWVAFPVNRHICLSPSHLRSARMY